MDNTDTPANIVALFLSMLDNNSPSAPPIPTPLLAMSARNKGISAREVASKIIERQVEAGAPRGALDGGGENISEKMEIIRVQEITNAILLNMRMSVFIPPGAPIVGTGVSPMGPVVVTGVVNGFSQGTGQAQ